MSQREEMKIAVEEELDTIESDIAEEVDAGLLSEQEFAGIASTLERAADKIESDVDHGKYDEDGSPVSDLDDAAINEAGLTPPTYF